MRTLLLVLVAILYVNSFTIPLLLGGISVDKAPDGTVGVAFRRGVNVNGNGADANTQFIFGKDGMFNINDEQNVLVNGTRSGPRSSIGYDKNGFNAGAGIAVTERSRVPGRKNYGLWF
ncbi:hypothetical protein Q1695_012917 [Nippostrongylus brasiliensis]|nr:hypothetical protein Q1695_012917 [Nippostrongylus brasiliensis]